MKNIYIDCGAHLGKVSLEFYKKHSDYQFYLFEVNPELLPNLRNICKNNNKFILIEKAVWTENIQMPFYFGNNPKGSSLFKEKINLNTEREPVIVQCIDLSSWIKNNFSAEDNIFLKMDVEGSEYHILEKMLKENTIDYINKLKIEFHLGKIEDLSITRERHNSLIEELNKRTHITKDSSHL
jgi:FkbM family methyltransferase